MGLARSCKSEVLVQYYRVQKRDGKTRLKNRKCNSNAGSGSGSKFSVVWQTQWANLELRTLKTRQNSNQMIHNAQQRTAGYGGKRLINLI